MTRLTRALPTTAVLAVVLAAVVAVPARAQDAALADFFGFDGLEVIKIGRSAGPIGAADVNGDGLTDLIVVNNHMSRIEIHYQRSGAQPEAESTPPPRVNELPEHWRFRRQSISVTHRVEAVIAHDFDDDGLVDLVYGGQPAELVFVRQSTPGVFEVTRRHRVKDLAANRDGLATADLIGDERAELVALVAGEIHVWTMAGDSIGQPVTTLAVGGEMVAFILEDFDGDARLDVAGVLPEDPAPLRMWFGGEEDGQRTLGAEIRFEMPALRELDSVRLAGTPAARIAAIERPSKRLVLYELVRQRIAGGPVGEASMLVHSFTDPGNRKRDEAVVDVDGDGLPDLIATDTEANALVVYRQAPGKGLLAGESFPSYADLDYLAAGNVDDDPYAELFVLSEKEGVAGRADAGPRGIPFPRPLPVSEGHTPVALNLVELDDGPHVAVVAKSGRAYVIDLIDMEGGRETIELGSLSRSPETIIALDADQDGRADLLLFTRDKPMTMLRAGDEGFVLTESKDMGQYGLVKSARAENTAVLDVDGDGTAELLIADRNFVRAVRYETEPPAGVSPGWQVVEQINAANSTSQLVSLAILGERIIAADKENDRLVVLARGGDGWSETDAVTVRGFSFDSIYAGTFSGDGEENILAIGKDGFAIVRRAGERFALREIASWRSTEERRVQHEIASGDVNSDGFTDLVSLDAGEQMCEIFTFSEAHRMLYATGFQVFESKIFSGGEPREYQPRQVLVADVTGDGRGDIVLLSHDRVLIYPQMGQP
ncbi:MAG: FG-GAP repeat domain-containing protein [Planctomycetota bacterium]